MSVTLGDIALAASGTVEPAAAASVPLSGVGFDSRRVSRGELFLALPGTRVDGHDYVAQALRAGAAAALVQRAPTATGSAAVGPLVLVADTVSALTEIATALHRDLAQAGTRTVAITGSNGKTTTKDLLAHVLRTVSGSPDAVAAPPGSYNNEVGLPVTVIRAAIATQRPRHLILEMGARGAGHIRGLCAIAPPDIGVVLMVGSAHLAEFGSREALARAKAEMAEGVGPTGVCILNADDPIVAAMAARTSARVVGFGTVAAADVRAFDVDIDAAACARFTLGFDGVRAPVALPLPGPHHVTNALAVAAVALTEGYGVEEVAAALSTPGEVSPHRMAVTARPDGVTILDDAYNANPESMAAALRSLAVLGRSRGKGGRTWAVLGEMLELGEAAGTEHDAIGRLAVRLNINRLVVVGQGARALHLGAQQEGSWGGESQWVRDADAARAVLEKELAAGDVVLVKASNSVRLWQLATDLISTDVLATDLLAADLVATHPAPAAPGRGVPLGSGGAP